MQNFESLIDSLNSEIIRRVRYEDIPWNDLMDRSDKDYKNRTSFVDIHTVDYCLHFVMDVRTFRIGWGTYNGWTYALAIDIVETTEPSPQHSGCLLDMSNHIMWNDLINQRIISSSIYWADFDGMVGAYPQGIKISTERSHCYLSVAEFFDDKNGILKSIDNILVTRKDKFKDLIL